MIRNELVTRSPLRILEQSIHGGLGKGNVGVIAAPQGVGKTACLVHIATDQLIEGKHVIHVSFSSDTSHIIAWYEDIFEEIARRYRLDGAMDVHDDIIRHRVIMNFRQDGVTALQVQRSIKSMIAEGNFNADVVIIDGYDFYKTNQAEFGTFKKFAAETGLEIWFSATVRKDAPQPTADGIPHLLTAFIPDISVLIVLKPFDRYILLSLIKDHDLVLPTDLHLKLDPHILLIAGESET
jgi:KaiC/GvpD/RAD55 family RecA-like ATPase